MQLVPAPVPFVHHGLQFAGSVCAVLAGQAAVLFIHQLQLGQALMDLPLERLCVCERDKNFDLLSCNNEV